MAKVEVFVFNPFQENTFLIHDDSKECVIIDPGCYDSQEYENLEKFISSNELKPVKIINTHCHVDHIIGNGLLKKQFQIPIMAHEEEVPLNENAVEMAGMIGLAIEKPPAIDIYLKDGEEVVFGQTALQVLHVPGHSPGGIALYNREEGFVIAGDALFNGSIGRTDLPGGDYNTLIHNIQTKLIPLPCETKVYPGHGPATTILSEKQNNTFLI